LNLPRKKVIFFTIFLAFVSTIFTFQFTSLASATIYLNVSAKILMQPAENITISGSITNTSTSDTINGITITATLASTTASQDSGTDGTFRFNITAPSTVGEKFITISTSSSSLSSRVIPVFVSNVTTGSISYLGSFPPFSNGTNITANITLLNGTSVVTNYFPNVSVYRANGAPMSWGIYNNTTDSGSKGYIVFNITVPASAEVGQYAFVVERGAIFSVFEIRSNYIMAVQTQTTADEVGSVFPPGSTVNLLAKVRKTNGDSLTATSASALVTLPNSTVRNVTLYSHPTLTGQYNNTFTETSASGTYNVEFHSIVARNEIIASTIFNTKTFNVNLEMQKKFSQEWGGQAAFKAGGTVVLDIVPINLTDETTVNVGGATWPACNTSYLKLVDVYTSNGTSINNSISDVAFSTSQSFTDNVCKISFTAPSVSGIYGLKVNVTIGGVTQQADTYIAVQKVFLKISPVSSLGGQEDFMQMVSPGDNVTLDITAFNLTTQAAISGNSITGITAKRMIPLEFSSGSTEITNITQSATTGANPQLIVQVPSTALGPTLVVIEANVGDEKVVGNAFFVSNYLMGFISPSSSGGGGSPGGGPGGGGGFSSCSGIVTFQGSTQEVKTASAAQGVSITNIVQAREEMTGRDVTPYLSISGSTSSSSSGAINVNVTFDTSSYSFSGSYFMVFNATYKGNTAGLPAGFMCKRLNFWPQIQAIGTSQESWRISPSSGVNITISNVQRVNDSANITNRSYVLLPQIFNFNPSKGGMNVLNAKNVSALNATFTSVSTDGSYQNTTLNFANLVIYPQNFTSNGQDLTEWPNGFLNLQPRVVSKDIDGASDTGFGGFQVVSFDAWINDWNWGSKSAGQTVSYVINARTNVSKNVTIENNVLPGTNFTRTASSNNVTGFTVKIGRPWEGELTTIQEVNATLISDGWNKSSDRGLEVWNLTFTIPQTTKKGEAQIIITVNNSNGQETDMDMWSTITKYTVIIPSEEGLGGDYSSFDKYFIPMIDNGTCSGGCGGNTSAYGWNMTYINYTYGITSRSSGWAPGWVGKVCLKNQFNTTRYIPNTNNKLSIVVNSSVRIAVVDNATAGTYDTIIINNTEGKITILNTTNINSRQYDSTSLYLWEILDCGYVKFVNASSSALPSSNNWAGTHQASVNFTVPYVVTLSGIPQQSVNVSVNGMGKQDDRGFGFDSKLIRGDNPLGNYTSVPVNATTNADGIAFVSFNVSATGRLVEFWKIDTIAGDTDTASMSSGTNVEVKSFRTNGNTIYDISQGYVDLSYVTNSPGTEYLGAFPAGMSPAEPWVYAANVTETSANSFVRDDTQTTYYIVYAPIRNATKMSTNFNLGNVNSQNLNSSISIDGAGNTQLAVGQMRPNSTVTGSVKFLYYTYLPQPSGTTTVTTPTQNISVAICAEGFERPNGRPKEGAAVKLTVTDWSTQPATTKNLQLYELENHSAISLGSTVATGPKGCVALKVGPGELLTWPSASAGKPPVFVEGTVTSGSSTENVYVTDVFRP